MNDRRHDAVALSDTERRAFDEIERALGAERKPAETLRRGARRWWASPWAGRVLLVLGSAVMLAAFAQALPVALAGAALFALGLWPSTTRLFATLAARHQRPAAAP
ncbi:MAG: DUF3040 domain-containing protein [Acidimicrobiia bacterium]